MARFDSPAQPAPPTVIDEESAPSTRDDFTPSPTVAEDPGMAATSFAFGARAGTYHDPLDSHDSGERPAVQRSWSGPPPPMDDDDDLVGTTLCDTYTIRRVVGEGGMGRVYEALHTRIENKRFAIKTLHREYARKREVITRFKREAEATASLSSPHVVGVYDVDRTPDGRPFLVAEFLEGEELGDLLDRVGKMEVGRAVRIVRQVCKGLAAAHDKGIVHRDVKPENVFLVGDPSDPSAKVLDFGISRLADGDEGTALTKTGMVIGTPAYMAPEQARGERVDHRADIYGVGAILYAALTGRVPFERDDPAATVVAVLTQEPERPRALEPSIPEHLEFVIQKAMAREPDERYQSMRELDEALAPYDPRERSRGAEAGLAVAQTVPDDDAMVRDARPLLVLFVVVALLSVVVGLITLTTAVMRLLGAELSAVEIAVILVGGGLGLITPLVLIARHIQKTAWNNSVRALELVRSVQRPLVAAAIAYGFAALFARFVHHVLYPFPGGVSQPIWDVLLFVTAVITGGATALLGQRARDKAGKQRKAPAPLAHPFGLAMSLTVLIAAVVIAPATLHDEDAGMSASGMPFIVIGNASGSGEAGEVPGFSSRDRATTEELDKAKTGGVQALSALLERYPKDPTVAAALMVEQSKTSDGLPAALTTLEKLIGMRPKAVGEAPVHEVLLKAVDSGGEAAQTALGIMATKLGSHGPDLLYQVMNSRPVYKARATELLSDENVRKLATPACLIAFDLSQAKSCAKVALLDRVAEHGDERCAEQLKPLLVKKRRGCGFLGLSACPAPCGKDEPAIRKALEKIEARASK